MRRLFFLLGLLLTLSVHFYLSREVWDIRASVRRAVEADYVLPSKFSRILAFGYKGLFSDYLFLKGVTFYGERQLMQQQLSDRDWNYLVTTLDVSTDLDPYFFDPYILAEGLMAWEGKLDEANKLLEKGRKYRDFDWRIPYFIGFNYFYFLHDYDRGGDYIMEAAKLPGSPEFLPTLAARLAYYGGKSKTAIVFLRGMIEQTKDPRLRSAMETRLLALERAAELEELVERFKAELGQPPSRLNDLVSAGYLDRLPEDPYGGEWVIMKTGRVFSTSKFTSHKSGPSESPASKPKALQP